MSNVLTEEKQQQIRGLGRLGWSLRQIEDATGIRRETIGPYLKAVGIPVRRRGGRSTIWPPPKPATTSEVSTDPGGAKPATTDVVSTDSVPAPPTRAPSASACEPYRELIAEALGRGRNAVAIWQDLVDDHGFAARYASVRRFVVQLRGATPADAHVVITTAPGEEGQVDYGEGPMVREPVTGKYRRTRLFVLTLGFSRKCVRLLTWRSSAEIWAQLHERAFRRLGGTVKVIVLDNLGEGVLTPDIYDPALNPLFRDVLAHYGVIALPCRVGDPDRKGKVEAGVGHTVCAHIQHHDGIPGIRRTLGVLALAKKHGAAVVEDAATAALEIGVPTYRFLRKYVEHRPPLPLTLRQVDPLIRQLGLYRELIDRKTGDPL